MSLSLFFALTLAPFLTAWLIVETVRQVAYARKLSKRLHSLRQHGVH